MTQDLKQLLAQKNDMIKQGLIVAATDKFFANHATTLDFDGTKTSNKTEMLKKMESFAGAIKNVNEITLHHSSFSENVSFAEYTFHFDMKDGSTILWHEIIRSVWEDSKIVNEQYFKN